MPEGEQHEIDQAGLRALWRKSVNALRTSDEWNLIVSNPEYGLLLNQLEHQHATLTPAAAIALVRAAMAEPGAPSVRFFRRTGGT